MLFLQDILKGCKSFLASNPGLQSRIMQTVHFPDYSVEELGRIAGKIAKSNGYILDTQAEEKIYQIAKDAIAPVISETSWCPTTFFADFCMIPKWEHFCIPIFFDNNTDWEKKAFLVQDCKHIKNFLLQRHLKKFIEIVHGCTVADKASYIEDNFWIWDNRVEYEWTPERIRYYRKLHAAIMRSFSKPHIR